MKRFIYHFISRHRRNIFLKVLNRICVFFRHAYNNKDFNHITNGELWLQKELSKLDIRTVFDVGANVGSWTRNACKTFRGSTVHSFEPIKPLFEKLKVNASNPRVNFVNMALADQEGEATFNYYPQKNVLSSRFDFNVDAESVQVSVILETGDHYCRMNGIDSIDFLKIDTEGSDHLVLKGFNNLLTHQRIRVIQFEYGALAIVTKFLLKDFYDFFSERGYVVGKCFPDHVDFSPYTYMKEDFIGLNFLAVRKADFEVIEMLQ